MYNVNCILIGFLSEKLPTDIIRGSVFVFKKQKRHIPISIKLRNIMQSLYEMFLRYKNSHEPVKGKSFLNNYGF